MHTYVFGCSDVLVGACPGQLPQLAHLGSVTYTGKLRTTNQQNNQAMLMQYMLSLLNNSGKLYRVLMHIPSMLHFKRINDRRIKTSFIHLNRL